MHTSYDTTVDEIPEQLPMLEAYIDEHYGTAQPLEGTTMVLIQHQLGSQVAMTQALIRLGVRPADIYWIDIPYTSNRKVQAALLELGIPQKNFSESNYHLADVYSTYQRKRVQARLADLYARLHPSERLLILDDGSYFLEAMACYEPVSRNMAIVEQTSRGIIKIENDATLYHYAQSIPIINVAKSRPKTELESPHVADAIAKSLIQRLEHEHKITPADQVLILGFGPIGRNVAESLQTACSIRPDQIHIADPNVSAINAAIKAGYRTWSRKQETLVRFKLVIGCSGTTSFGIGDRIFLDNGAFLVSASSGAAELSREAFIDLANSHPSDNIYVIDKPGSSIHDDIEINLVDRTVVFANGGFPINFDGGVSSVPPKFIQATHTLQIGAACQSTHEDLPKGVIELNHSVCEWVTSNYERMIKLCEP